MADVEKIHGMGAKEPDKDKSIPSSEEFKRLMEQDKVTKTDEEQKKHRKRPEKTEEEKALDLARLSSTKPGASKAVSGKEQAMKGTTPVKEGAPVQPAEISEEESSVLQETLRPSSIPPTAPSISSQAVPAPLKPQESTIGYHPPKTINEEISLTLHGAKPESIPVPAPIVPTQSWGVEETTAVSPSPPAEQKPAALSKPMEEPLGQAPLATPSAATSAAPTPPMTIQPYMQLTPEMLALFEKMVGVMSVMNTSGISQTTIELTSPQFASSIFYGAQIIIKEYSTAPRAYNIQILGSAKAVDYLQGKLSTLSTALQRGEYAFTVNRVEVGLLKSARARVTRKKNVKEEET